MNLLPWDPTKDFTFSLWVCYLVGSKIEGMIFCFQLNGFCCMNVIINGNDLVARMKSGRLVIIGGINMIADAYRKAGFFHEFTFEAIPRAFTEFQSSPRQLCKIPAANEFIANE